MSLIDYRLSSIVFCLSFALCAEGVFAQTGNCDKFNLTASDDVAQLTAVAAIRPRVWGAYDFLSPNYLMLSADPKNTCAVLVKKGKIIDQLTLTSHVDLPNKMYTPFVPSGGIHVNPEIDTLLVRNNMDRALVYYADFDPTTLGFSSAYAEATGLGNGIFTRGTLVHEGFHVFGQNVFGLSQTETNFQWPSWLIYDGRETIDKICYKGNKEIEARFRDEAMNLIQSAQLASLGDKTHALQAAKEFLKLRDLRRGLIKTAFTSDQLDFCLSREGSYEMLEGVAHWTGYGAQFVLGNVRLDQFVQYAYIDSNYDKYFYDFGMLQLYVLWRLFPADFETAVQSLVSSQTSSDGIESEFRIMISK